MISTANSYLKHVHRLQQIIVRNQFGLTTGKKTNPNEALQKLKHVKYFTKLCFCKAASYSKLSYVLFGAMCILNENLIYEVWERTDCLHDMASFTMTDNLTIAYITL